MSNNVIPFPTIERQLTDEHYETAEAVFAPQPVVIHVVQPTPSIWVSVLVGFVLMSLVLS